ncbi:leucine-rich repeat neuronal protein 1-like [Hetaerina americana]|uniref:leucine-rich repeat neuronal protein 1-like n=1 Tax=Hetaerina americana TaxID=62018 RepID=UPI003A7F27E9
MRLPTTRPRRPRASTQQPPCASALPFPPPPPHPSVLLRWDGGRRDAGQVSGAQYHEDCHDLPSSLAPPWQTPTCRSPGHRPPDTLVFPAARLDATTRSSGPQSRENRDEDERQAASRRLYPVEHITPSEECHQRHSAHQDPPEPPFPCPTHREKEARLCHCASSASKGEAEENTGGGGNDCSKNSRRSDASPWTSLEVRGWQHGRITAFLLLLFATSSTWRQCAALCPPRCQCDDLALSATCSDAALEVIPIQLNPEVESISLHGNRISAVDQSLGFYARLRHLDLSSNRLRSLGERNFQLQGSLAALNVSGNHIGAVSRHAFAGIGLSESLRVLDMARNRLGTFPLACIAGLKSLQELHLGHNQLTSVGDGDSGGEIHLHALEVLDLTGNRLQEVPTRFLSHLIGLRVLLLARNELSGLPDGSLPTPGLHTLSFAGNVNLGSSGMEDTALSSTSGTLSYLDLSDCGLTSVPIKALSFLAPALTDLDLSGNPIGEFPEGSFSPLRSLRRVHLSRLSLLSTVHPATFASLPTSSSLSSSPQAVTAMCPPQLEHISMEWNPGLQRLPDGLLTSCTRLTTLALRGAALEGLDATVLPAPPVRLRSLSLAGNPLRCNCSLMWLSALANATVGSQPFLDGARCAEPPRLAGRLLSRLPEAELRCEPSWETVLAIAMASVTFLLLVAFAILFGRRCARHHKCCGSLETPTPTPTAPPPPPPRRHFPPFNPSQHQNGSSHRKDMEFGVWGGKGPLGGGRDDSIAANEYTDLIGVGVGRMVIPAGYRGPTGVYV